MPYTPNNPYVPGDPYSYDLKWLVSQVEANRAALEGLDDRIRTIVIRELDQHDPVYYGTAQELIDSPQKAGSIAYIEGFNAAGDGGANLYYLTDDYNDIIGADFYLTMAAPNLWALPIILTPYVTPEMFGAKGDGTTDDTAALNMAAKIALSNKLYVQLMGKTYATNSPFNFNIENMRFCGISGGLVPVSTILNNAGAAWLTMTSVFQFNTFEYIKFEGNDQTLFDCSSNQVQSLTFDKCAFYNCHTIVNMDAPNNGSEFIFNMCKIRNCGSSSNPCDLFIMNNSQAVNWRFFATDAELFTGHLFNYLKGASVTWITGSIIPNSNNPVFNIPMSADANAFGEGNFPHFIGINTRFEMRNQAYLLDKAKAGNFILIIKDSCLNAVSGTTQKQIIASQTGLKVVFENCYTVSAFTVDYTINLDSAPYSPNSLTWIGIKDTDMLSILKNSVFTITGNIYSNEPVFSDGYRNYSLNVRTNINARSAITPLITAGGSDLTIMRSPNGTYPTYTRDVYGFIREIVMECAAYTPYGSYNGSFTITDDGGTVLGTLTAAINNGSATLKVDKYVKSLTITPGTDYPGTSLVQIRTLLTADVIA